LHIQLYYEQLQIIAQTKTRHRRGRTGNLSAAAPSTKVEKIADNRVL